MSVLPSRDFSGWSLCKGSVAEGLDLCWLHQQILAYVGLYELSRRKHFSHIREAVNPINVQVL